MNLMSMVIATVIGFGACIAAEFIKFEKLPVFKKMLESCTEELEEL